MILEQVRSHPESPDLFIDQVITPNEMVSESDKKIIRRILLKEFTRKDLKFFLQIIHPIEMVKYITSEIRHKPKKP